MVTEGPGEPECGRAPRYWGREAGGREGAAQRRIGLPWTIGTETYSPYRAAVHQAGTPGEAAPETPPPSSSGKCGAGVGRRNLRVWGLQMGLRAPQIEVLRHGLAEHRAPATDKGDGSDNGFSLTAWGGSQRPALGSLGPDPGRPPFSFPASKGSTESTQGTKQT